MPDHRLSIDNAASGRRRDLLRERYSDDFAARGETALD